MGARLPVLQSSNMAQAAKVFEASNSSESVKFPYSYKDDSESATGSGRDCGVTVFTPSVRLMYSNQHRDDSEPLHESPPGPSR